MWAHCAAHIVHGCQQDCLNCIATPDSILQL